jgi:hypothetical protein
MESNALTGIMDLDGRMFLADSQCSGTSKYEFTLIILERILSNT